LPTRITLFTPAIRLSSTRRTAIGQGPRPSSIDAGTYLRAALSWFHLNPMINATSVAT